MQSYVDECDTYNMQADADLKGRATACVHRAKMTLAEGILLQWFEKAAPDRLELHRVCKAQLADTKGGSECAMHSTLKKRMDKAIAFK